MKINPIIEVENLTFGYAGQPILQKVGFSVREGDFVAITGANGSGKSTLLRILLGELIPATGKVTLFGEDVYHFADWHKVGYVQQNGTEKAASFPASAMEIVLSSLYKSIGPLRFAGRVHKQRALQALEQVGMRDYAKRMLGEMSGGQQQRVLLARVLAAQPAVLILDEPTTGVDAKSSEELYALLAKLNQQLQVTTIMVTHDLARVSDYAQRIFCLEETSMIELKREQIASELAHKHKHPKISEQQKEGAHGNLSV